VGGLSAAFPLGPGMIFFDFRISADLGVPELEIDNRETYKRHIAAFSIGYEFGFFKKR
jgi:hypothetical protein